MDGLNLQALAQNPLIKTINDVLTGHVDGAGLGFEYAFQDGVESFKRQMSFVTETFDEAHNAIESIAQIPSNPYIRSVFYNWIDNLSVADLYEAVHRHTAQRPRDPVPQHVLVQCQFEASSQIQGKVYELQVRLHLMHKDDHGINTLLYPLSVQTFVMSAYAAMMRQ